MKLNLTQWEKNAYIVITLYDSHVDWEERFYECPFCGEPVYECDWGKKDLSNFICPICEERIEDDLEEE